MASRERAGKWAVALLSAFAIGGQNVNVIAQSSSATEPLRLTADEAVEFALAGNVVLAGNRLGPLIADEDVKAAATAWTPELSTRFGTNRSELPGSTVFDTSLASILDQQVTSETAWAQQTTWGTSYRLAWTGARTSSNSSFVRFDPQLQAGVTASVVQPILRGLRFDDARAAYQSNLQQRVIAGATLDGAAAETRRDVLHAYWAWVYAREFLAVQRESLALAQALLDGNRARVAVGAMAAVDVIEAEAEVARRSEAIVIAEKNVANGEDVVRLLVFDPLDPRSHARLEPLVVEPYPSSADGAVERSLTLRRDLVALRAALEVENIAVRRARNDTLPDASLRADYSLRGLAGTELLRAQSAGPVTGNLSRTFGSALDDVARSRYPAWSVELDVRYPIGTARAESEAARAVLKRRQAEVAVKGAEQQVATEVRAAIREVDANRRRLESTAAAVTLSERRLEAEQRKFAVGLSTSFFVFQAQRDLAQAREASLKSILDYRASCADIDAVQAIPIVRR